jgi:hypothetical protein
MIDDTKKNDIVIDSFTGGESGKDLKGCYFKYKGEGNYDFHDKDGKEKCKDLRIGSGCGFTLDEKPRIGWIITLHEPCSDKLVNGDWTNTVPDSSAEEGGTFQGQAGGTGEEANAASGSGY